MAFTVLRIKKKKISRRKKLPSYIAKNIKINNKTLKILRNIEKYWETLRNIEKHWETLRNIEQHWDIENIEQFSIYWISNIEFNSMSMWKIKTLKRYSMSMSMSIFSMFQCETQCSMSICRPLVCKTICCKFVMKCDCLFWYKWKRVKYSLAFI